MATRSVAAPSDPSHLRCVSDETVGTRIDAIADLQRELGSAYTFERELGRGAAATVYLARDEQHGRSVALKIMHPHVAGLVGVERFLLEIELCARLSHPLILPLLASGQVNGLPFFAMPYVDGESLRVRLDREGRLPLKAAARIACEVAEALDYAHSQGVLHRDIKPENIMLHGRHALVADFGVGKALSDANSRGLTRTGMILGTPAYMSLEQAAGEADLDGRSDLYSLGAVLFEMLAGEPPFTGPTAQAMIARRFVDPVPTLSGRFDGVPSSIDDFLARAMAPRREDRFATGAEFEEALDAC